MTTKPRFIARAECPCGAMIEGHGETEEWAKIVTNRLALNAGWRGYGQKPKDLTWYCPTCVGEPVRKR